MTDGDLERELRAWLKSEADGVAPPSLLHQDLQEIVTTPARRHVSLAAAIGVTATLAAAVVLGVIGFGLFRPVEPLIGADPTDSVQASVSSAASVTPSPTPTPSAIPTGPPETTPSATPHGVAPVPIGDPGPLVLRFMRIQETGANAVYSLYADGTLLSSGEAGDRNVSILRQKITQDAVIRLAQTVVNTGLFQQSADYPPVPTPGSDYPQRGASGYAVTVMVNGSAIRVSWTSVASDEADWAEPSPTREGLDALVPSLFPLDVVLTDADFIDQVPAPAQASRFGVYVNLQPWAGGSAPTPDIADIDWPLGGSMLEWADQAFANTDDPSALARCGVVDAEAANALYEQLDAYGAESVVPRDPSGLAQLRLGDREGLRVADIVLLPLLPDEPASCADTGVPAPWNRWGQLGETR